MSADSYSLLMFLVYLLSKNEQYKTLSELIFVLDKNSLLQLVKYFGGTTITIPTAEELNNIIRALYFHKLIEQDKVSVDKAYKLCNAVSMKDKDKLTTLYTDIRKLIEKYDIEIK